MPLGLFIKRRSVWMPCALITALVLIYALWPEPKVDPTPSLPSPNGYDDFIKAGQLAATISGDFSQMTTEELRSTLATNREPLRLARLGLQRECRVPTEDSMAYVQTHISDLSSIKRLAQLLSAEGRLAEVEIRYDAAAKIHIEIMHLGQASARGGLIIDKLVGVAVENIGIERLARVVGQLDTQSCRATIAILEEIDARNDVAAVYLKRDRKWVKATYGVSDWIRAAWIYKSLNPFRNNDQTFSSRLLKTDRRRRQLLLDLAARAYELEHGKRPLRAEDLVPSVLRAVPKDPETGTNLVLNPVN
jgi:hypothetical protein